MLVVSGQEIYKTRFRKVWIAQLFWITAIVAAMMTMISLFGSAWLFLVFCIPLAIFFVAMFQASRDDSNHIGEPTRDLLPSVLGYHIKYDVVDTGYSWNRENSHYGKYPICAEYMANPVYKDAVEEYYNGRLKGIIPLDSPSWKEQFFGLNEQMKIWEEQQKVEKTLAKPSTDYVEQAKVMNKLDKDYSVS
jgi:hypothetical protein